MGTLWMIRHGQASPLAEDYDRLSPLGEQQARLLGEHWVQRGQHIDRVFCGPRLRQRRSAEIACASFAAGGGTLPSPVLVPELDEMHGDRMLRDTLPALMAEHEEVRCLAQAYQAATARRLAAGITEPGHTLAEEAMQAFDRLFQHVMRRWIEGQVEAGHLEAWPRFRARIQEALATLCNGAEGQTLAVFSSAGPTAAAVGQALGLDDARTVDLMWQVKNGAVTELRFSAQGLRLHAFNTTPHLRATELETLR